MDYVEGNDSIKAGSRVRQLQTEPGLTPGYQNNGGHIYFVFRLLLLMLAIRLKAQQDEKLYSLRGDVDADRHSEYV